MDTADEPYHCIYCGLRIRSRHPVQIMVALPSKNWVPAVYAHRFCAGWRFTLRRVLLFFQR